MWQSCITTLKDLQTCSKPTGGGGGIEGQFRALWAVRPVKEPLQGKSQWSRIRLSASRIIECNSKALNIARPILSPFEMHIA